MSQTFVPQLGLVPSHNRNLWRPIPPRYIFVTGFLHFNTLVTKRNIRDFVDEILNSIFLRASLFWFGIHRMYNFKFIIIYLLYRRENIFHNRKIGSSGWEGRFSWWRHQMETFSALLAGNSTVTGEFPYKDQWRGALVFPPICAWTHVWLNNRDAGDLRRHRAHHDVTVMSKAETFVFMMYWFLANTLCWSYNNRCINVFIFPIHSYPLTEVLLYI